jgi:signal transduction histidine kinase
MTHLLGRRTVRVRLALLYAGIFLLLGTAVIAVIVLATKSNPPVVTATPNPNFVVPGVPTVPTVPSVHVRPGRGGPTVVIRPGRGLRSIRVSPPADALVAQHTADVNRLLVVAWIVLALTALVSIPLGWFAAGRMLRPVREITRRTRSISAGNLHERLALEGPRDEFTELGATLDDLFARLQTSFEAQRRFVANASHELRTPLTVERTLLQVALADPNASAATLRATCEELLAAGREQEALLEAMLTLAASESGIVQREPVDLAEVAAHVLAKPRAEIDAGGLSVTSDLNSAATTGDPDLLERMLANLVDNAVQHNIPAGTVRIRTGIDEGRPFAEVANSGVVIAPVEVPVLFEPFRRMGTQRVGDSGHQGLGLSIVRAIATAHGGTVDATPGSNGGLTVVVRLPAPDPAADVPVQDEGEPDES